MATNTAVPTVAGTNRVNVSGILLGGFIETCVLHGHTLNDNPFEHHNNSSTITTGLRRVLTGAGVPEHAAVECDIPG